MLPVNDTLTLRRVGNHPPPLCTGYRSAHFDLTRGPAPVLALFLALIRCEFLVLCCLAL